MSGTEILILFAIEAICGAAGGVAIARWKEGDHRSWFVSGVAGSIGGLMLAWFAGFVPWLARFVWHVESAADATMLATGGLTPTVMVGAGIAGLLGGLILTAAAGSAFRRGVNNP